MTTTQEGARMELTPPGPVSQKEWDDWFKTPRILGVDIGRNGSDLTVEAEWRDGKWARAREIPRRFDPTTPLTHNQSCILKASNALCRDRVPHGWGGHFSPVGETRHWGK